MSVVLGYGSAFTEPFAVKTEMTDDRLKISFIPNGGLWT